LIFHPIGSAESRKTSSGSAFLLSSSPQMRTTGARKHLRAASFWTQPCTATGTIRRHPDLPWLKAAADLYPNETLQSELLDAAAEMTAPGGRLVYAVCSLEPEEGSDQIAAFLRGRSNFARLPISPGEVFDAGFVSPEGDLRTLPSDWPERGGMDGFYAARLTRTA